MAIEGPLVQTPSRSNVPSWPSINFDGIRDRLHTPHQNINPFDIKTHLEHNFLQTTPFHPIIGFTHIKFDSHLTHLPHSLLINMMYYFKSNQHIISNKAFRHECTLILSNDFWKQTLQSIGFSLSFDY